MAECGISLVSKGAYSVVPFRSLLVFFLTAVFALLTTGCALLDQLTPKLPSKPSPETSDTSTDSVAHSLPA
ncbi:MAG: hypothetical protein HYX24_01905 [Candidatus Aenigmarchaeota archaeon]|nr:hypothetical protein [Candidatus Aenigmarchaeota archaeon]